MANKACKGEGPLHNRLAIVIRSIFVFVSRRQSLLLVLVSSALTLAAAGVASGQSTDPRRLAKLLGSQKEMVRLKAVATIAASPRLKYDQLNSIIEGLASQFDGLEDDQTPPPSTVALMYMVGSTNRGAAIEFIEGLLDTENPEVLMLAVDVIGGMQAPQVTESLIDLIDHPAYEQFYALRFGVIRSLWSIRTADSLNALATIYRQIDGQLRADLDRMFAEVDEGDFGDSVDDLTQWKARWDLQSSVQQAGFAGDAANDSRVKIASVSDGGSVSAPKIQFAAPEYYGIPIEAKRLLFVLDHSGSMKEPVGGGGTRLMRAKQELIYVIQNLPSDHEFSVMIFSNRMRLWSRDLRVASSQNKAKATQFVKDIGYGDRTNTHGALSMALGFDSSLEAVYILTDGRPTLGSIVHARGIVDDIAHRNRFRHLRFHTIGVSVEGQTKAFLETLASCSNAEFREVQ